MALKTAADAAGKPIYLEMSSINPVARAARRARRARQQSRRGVRGKLPAWAAGSSARTPGFVVLFADARTEQFIDEVRRAFDAAPAAGAVV